MPAPSHPAQLWARQPEANRARLQEDAHTSRQPCSPSAARRNTSEYQKRRNAIKTSALSIDRALSVSGHLKERGCKALFEALQGAAFIIIIIYIILLFVFLN